MNKKLYSVKFKFFSFEYKNSFKKPCCLTSEYCEFLFNWSIETAKQFAKHLLSMVNTKFFISSFSEVEAITSKKEVFQSILDKSVNKKIDKFELLSIIPFIVESNFDIALSTTLSFFCLENEFENMITRNECGLFIDSYFKSLHKVVLLEDGDEIYEKTLKGLVRLSDSELEEILVGIFGDTDELKLEDVTK
jgi:hypothetical protein